MTLLANTRQLIFLAHHRMFELGSAEDFATVFKGRRLTKEQMQSLVDPPAYVMCTRLALAGVSAAVAQFFVQPIETVKVRLQNQTASSKDGFASMTRRVVSTEGVAGLWKGMAPATMRELSYSAMRFGLYIPIKQLLGASTPQDTPFWKKLVRESARINSLERKSVGRLVGVWRTRGGDW